MFNVPGPLMLVCKHKDLHASCTSSLLSGAQPLSQAQVSVELRLSTDLEPSAFLSEKNTSCFQKTRLLPGALLSPLRKLGQDLKEQK